MELELYFDPHDTLADFDEIAKKEIRIFGRRIPLYDVLMGFWEHRANAVMMEMIDKSCLNGKVLELGVGTGHLLSLLVKKFEGNEIWGVDFSGTMLKTAQARIDRLFDGGDGTTGTAGGTRRCTLLRSDCFDMPAWLDSFSIIASSFLLDLQNGQGIARLLQECSARCLPGGHIFIASLDGTASQSRASPLERGYFNLANRLYSMCYRSKRLRELSRSLFSGYFTHCRPIDIEAYIKHLPELTVAKTRATSISILGLPILPVRIVEIAKKR
jgi:ubiquinone/menaquinone biosynthesis C-methylase UbiE